jgi:hypothetical protein
MIFRRLRDFISHISSVVAFNQLPPERRQIVFYSEGGTYWVHLSALLKEVLASDRVGVCYISSNVDDPGLKLQHPRLSTFRIDEGAIRNWLFESIDTRVMVMTMPDLHQYQVKKSRHRVHYVYTQHSLVSFHMVYRPGSFDHFDTIFCAGPHHLEEIRALQGLNGFAPKNLVRHGYPRLDEILVGKPDEKPDAGGKTRVLIAPSWGADSITDTLAIPLIEALLSDGFRVTFRPHPQSQKFSAAAIGAVLKRFGGDTDFDCELNVASKESLYGSDVMICDWSGAALDYAFGLEKPVLFVDVPRKINNPDYEAVGIEPFEVGIREIIGAVMSPADVPEAGEHLRKLLARDMAAEIRAARARHVFNVGHCEVEGAQSLLELVDSQRARAGG